MFHPQEKFSYRIVLEVFNKHQVKLLKFKETSLAGQPPSVAIYLPYMSCDVPRQMLG